MGADIQKKNRIIWLDAARTLGIMLVVGCHAVETYYRPVLRGKAANVKHFFTLLGKMFFAPYGKEFFTYLGKQIFTS